MAGTQEKCSLGRFFGKEAECVAAGGICSSRPGRAGSALHCPGPDSAASVDIWDMPSSGESSRDGKLSLVTSHTRDNCHELVTILRHPWQGSGNELGDLVSIRSFPRWWNSFLDQFTIRIITSYVSTQLWEEENRSEVNIAQRGSHQVITRRNWIRDSWQGAPAPEASLSSLGQIRRERGTEGILRILSERQETEMKS